MTYKAYEISGEKRQGHELVTCDHATNFVPDFVNGGTLGLSSEDMNRHIAYDVGAAGLSRYLAEALDCPALLSNFSRLVIDPNRGEDDPTLLMRLYDGTIIPANRYADATEREARLHACYRPYHQAFADLAARHDDTVIISIHSFTPQLNGRAPRPWQVGVLFASDRRLATPLIDELQREADLCVGINQPYDGYLGGDSIDRHAIVPGRLNALIEVRNDLIKTDAQQREWSDRLAPIVHRAIARAKDRPLVPADEATR